MFPLIMTLASRVHCNDYGRFVVPLTCGNENAENISRQTGLNTHNMQNMQLFSPNRSTMTSAPCPASTFHMPSRCGSQCKTCIGFHNSKKERIIHYNKECELERLFTQIIS